MNDARSTGQRTADIYVCNENGEQGDIRWKLAVTKSTIQFQAPPAVGRLMSPSVVLVPKVVS